MRSLRASNTNTALTAVFMPVKDVTTAEPAGNNTKRQSLRDARWRDRVSDPAVSQPGLEILVPPNRSMAVTITFVARPKTRNTVWVRRPAAAVRHSATHDTRDTHDTPDTPDTHSGDN